MATEHPRLRPGEYIVLPQPYLGLPAGSLGTIIEYHSTPTQRYLVYFGLSVPIGPFPEAALIRLRSAGARSTAPWSNLIFTHIFPRLLCGGTIRAIGVGRCANGGSVWTSLISR